MTKEIDFLTLGKSDSTSANVTKVTGTEKKEGLSLFDSLLAVSKEEISNKNEQSAGLNDTLTKSETVVEDKKLEASNNQSNTTKTQSSNDKIIEVVKQPNDNNLDTEFEKSTKNLTNTNLLKIDKIEPTAASSLLDRMVLEAKQSLKTTEVQTQNSLEVPLKKEFTNILTTEISETKVDKTTSSLKNIESEITNKNEINSSEPKIIEKSQAISSEKIVNNNSNATLINENEIENLETKEIDISKLEAKNSVIVESKTSVKITDNINIEVEKNTIVTNKDQIENNQVRVDNPESKTLDNSKIVGKENLQTINMSIEYNDSLKDNNTKKEEIATSAVNSDFDEDMVTKKDEKLETENSSLLDKLISRAKKEIEKDTDREESTSLKKQELKPDNSTITDDVNLKEVLTSNKTTNTKEEISIKQVQVTMDFEDNPDISNVSEVKDEVKKENKEILKDDTNSNILKSDNQILDKSLKEQTQNSEKIVTSTTVNNEKIAEKESKNIFASIGESSDVEVKVDLSKDDIEKLKNEDTTSFEKEEAEIKPKSRSLMDRLLDNAKEQTISTKNIMTNNVDSSTNDVATNIFLSSQKNSIYTQMLANKSEGVKIVKNASSVEDIKKAANIMDLDLKDLSVEIEESSVDSIDDTISPKIEKSNSDSNLLNKLAFNKKMNVEEYLNKLNENNIANNSNLTQAQNTNTTNITTTNTTENIVNLNVNQTLALTIQNRIIGAQQQMSSMMSDVARSMYENYKPPVTAFRLNLFPAQLGHIAILMRNERDNSISISMNMSQSSTLDAFVDNQSLLRDALNRNFNNSSTTFNLDFNMQENSSNGSSSNNEQTSSNQENGRALNHSSDEILESIVQNQDVGKDLNYL